MLVWYVGVHCNYLAQDRTYWRAVVKKNMTYSKKDRKYLDHLVTLSYSRKICRKSFCCVLNLYIPLLYIYIYYSSVKTTILYWQRLERHVSTYKVIVRLPKNYETLTKWLHAFGIPDGLQYVP
jgi:hypothetical protein